MSAAAVESIPSPRLRADIRLQQSPSRRRSSAARTVAAAPPFKPTPPSELLSTARARRSLSVFVRPFAAVAARNPSGPSDDPHLRPRRRRMRATAWLQRGSSAGSDGFWRSLPRNIHVAPRGGAATPPPRRGPRAAPPRGRARRRARSRRRRRRPRRRETARTAPRSGRVATIACSASRASPRGARGLLCGSRCPRRLRRARTLL